ncbi:undecaprenyl/decaprenyl-phosphate alpha-N-acetylglucosaminyl 1-phosphate transferase [Schaalia sp. ZJ405]|uniref:glycosyltransferase family 4 protein n=1 Tax=unclassified Schaalia TaxID=2691889 RepID=UPI0013E9F2CC|nr:MULTISPECIES: MraY family glycosyltransferase [unclassified Schaalia]QPK80620.1 undecaprenyl/decaprenyl-phosphate alpha-N-acetylglucosaminyl 1-phosphate transferase [Schaalia sp. ZJ405]
MKVYLLLMLVAMGVTVLMTPLVRWACVTWGIVPELRSRDLQAQPIPRLGGVAMTIGLLVTMLVASRIPYMVPLFTTHVPWALMGAAAAMCVLGVIDDIFELDWMAKLAGQILIAGVMAFYGVQLVTFPIFGVTIGSSRLSLIVTVFLVVGIVNAVNFIDGLDGLAAGMVAIGAGAFFIYSYILTRIMGAASYATTASLAVIALMGVCLGFLWFNFHPSSIMMGGGAETLGLVLAGAGIIVTGQIDPSQLGGQQIFVGVLPLLLPLSVIFMPVADLVVTSIRRMLRGHSPFKADRSHFHDRLLLRGHSHRSVVAILWMWTAIVCLPAVGLLVTEWTRVLVFTIPAFLVAVALTLSEFPNARHLSRSANRRRVLPPTSKE